MWIFQKIMFASILLRSKQCTGGVEEHVCLATITSSKEKGPAAIWTHMSPILDLVKASYPNVNTVHFFSDGPCTQYRQSCTSVGSNQEPGTSLRRATARVLQMELEASSKGQLTGLSAMENTSQMLSCSSMHLWMQS